MNKPAKYRKKPVVIEAMQFYDTKEGIAAAMRFLPFGGILGDERHGWYLSIKTLEGTMTCRSGDWIIKGVKGEFYPVKDDIFRATYEEVG